MPHLTVSINKQSSLQFHVAKSNTCTKQAYTLVKSIKNASNAMHNILCADHYVCIILGTLTVIKKNVIEIEKETIVFFIPKSYVLLATVNELFFTCCRRRNRTKRLRFFSQLCLDIIRVKIH